MSSSGATTSGSTWPGGWRARPGCGPWCWATSPARATRSTWRRGSTTSRPGPGSASLGWTTGPERTPARSSTSSRPTCSISRGRRPTCRSASPGPPASRSRRTVPTSPDVDQLNRWDLAGAERDLQPRPGDRHHLRPRLLQARAHPRLAGRHQRFGGRPRDRAGDGALRQPPRARPHRHQRLPRVHRRRVRGGARPLPAPAGPRRRRRRRVVRAGRGVVPRHRRARPRAGVHPGDPRLPAHPRPRSRLRAGLRPRAVHARHGGRSEARLRAGGERLVRPRGRAGRPAAGGQPRAPGRDPPGPDRGAEHRAQLGRDPAGHAAGPRGDGERLPRVRELRRRAGRGGPLPQHHPGAPGAAVRRGPDPVRLGRRGPGGGAAAHRAGHRGAAGLPALPGHSDRRSRHRGGGERLRLPGRPRQRGEGARSGRPGPARGGQAPGRPAPTTRWTRAGAGWCWASSTPASACPAASLRQVWQSAAEAGRMAAADSRKHLVHSGASAAIGLFTGPSADSTALVEYRAHDRRVARHPRCARCWP